MTFSWLNYPPWPPCPPCLTMLQMQMLCAGQIQYHFGRNISPETTSPGQSASSELTNVVPAPPKVLEMDWNQTEVKLYVRRRANLSKFCWYVTFWKFPSHSKILQTLTEGCGNRLSICQVRCVAVFVAPSYHISWHVQIERRWHCLDFRCYIIYSTSPKTDNIYSENLTKLWWFCARPKVSLIWQPVLAADTSRRQVDL